ncbi:MAG: DUF368 domain-containing protein [Pseudomonadales bacterium]|jgi:putative membrane protein|nr:DUF368 domain-containing protein [Gammaproteobacteria bacterium]MBP6052256.1 DUF368 domain-containing protein [Pseudomonadales bacterium]MBK6581730.1 DUF368 domain-containing protein [Gammaproteobacteria bacterium]MBK7170082.1 DUF368 domain-containing protein [Gammaproteobacteria bacterium]MBK7520565.1 DUF368 domain-containing protein [Gammaproteobacteria bacterium]
MSANSGKAMFAVYLRGMAMGIADLIPGVSGGTVALVTGIYDRLVGAIAAFGLPSLRLLLRGEIRAFWTAIDGTFLLVLVAGVASSVLSLAGVLGRLLEQVPQLVWALFFGLIAASILHLARIVGRWRPTLLLALAAGAALAWWITHLGVMEPSDSRLWVVFCGMIAICAWILPGISGSFVLLVLGMYEHIIGAIHEFELSTLALFAIGCASGLMLFTHLLRWALARYHALIMAHLTGFLLGSLPLLWPWQADNGQLGREMLLPAGYLAASGRDPQILACVLLMVSGFTIVLLLEYLGRKHAS